MRANSFAAALLLPEAVVRDRVAPGFDEKAFATLALELSVSPSALAYRLETLRLIDAMARDRWRAMSAKTAAKLAGAPTLLAQATAYSSEPRQPGPLSRDLLTAYLDDASTLRPYARLLGVDAAQLREDLERSAAED